MKNNMYNMKTKISVIKEFNNGLSRKELAEKYDISYFLVSTWIKQREKLLQAYEIAKQNRNPIETLCLWCLIIQPCLF